MDPHNSQVIWTGGMETAPTNRSVVSKSTNGGNTWSRYIRTQWDGYFYAIAVDPMNSNIVYAGGSSDSGIVFEKTTNSGASWFSIAAGITSDTINSIAIDPDNPAAVYAGTPDGIYKSSNAGAHWGHSGCTEVSEVIIDPSQTSMLYAGTATGVYRSTDYGDTWEDMNDGLSCLDITSMDISPDHYLYCGTDSVGIFRWSIAVHADEFRQEYPGGGNTLFATPNPALERTTICFTLMATASADINIYNTQGRLIKSFADTRYSSGSHTIVWDGCDNLGRKMSSGVYFVELHTNTRTSTTKLSLISR
jgi:hypothetical protein